MLKRFTTINAFSGQEKQEVYFTPDAVIHEVKNRKVYAK